jgi:hypothetical protein
VLTLFLATLPQLAAVEVDSEQRLVLAEVLAVAAEEMLHQFMAAQVYLGREIMVVLLPVLLARKALEAVAVRELLVLMPQLLVAAKAVLVLHRSFLEQLQSMLAVEVVVQVQQQAQALEALAAVLLVAIQTNTDLTVQQIQAAEAEVAVVDQVLEEQAAQALSSSVILISTKMLYQQQARKQHILVTKYIHSHHLVQSCSDPNSQFD